MKINLKLKIMLKFDESKTLKNKPNRLMKPEVAFNI